MLSDPPTLPTFSATIYLQYYNFASLCAYTFKNSRYIPAMSFVEIFPKRGLNSFSDFSTGTPSSRVSVA